MPSTSSSSSFDSSSSSSYLDNHGNKLLPFTIGGEISQPVHCFEFYGETVFAGTGNNGFVIKSVDRYIWSSFYKTEDTHVTALKVNENYLYIGTSPSCHVYRVNLSTNVATDYGELGGTASSFAVLDNNLYFAIEDSPRIYKYNVGQDEWNLFYKPYGRIKQMKNINGLLYVVMEKENIICFDGTDWKIVDLGADNISSIRNVSKNVFSYDDYTFIDRTATIETKEWNEEKIFDVFPSNISIGLNSIEKDGTSLVLGSFNKPRIYRYMENDTKVLFDTQGEMVHCLININTGVNLAAIDNKLYLLYSGEIGTNAYQVTPTVQEAVDIVSATNVENQSVQSIIITYPMAEEIFELGETINIQWSSVKSVNDAVKIVLKQNEVESLVINSKTSNTGSYEWEMPLSTAVGINYQIYIEWLSASNGTIPESNYSISGNFSIVSQTTTTTATTITPVNPERPPTINQGIPIMELPKWEYITSMAKDPIKDWILFSTSEGRIFRCDQTLFNAYLTGEKTVYANVSDSFGNISDSASVCFFYALYRKIAEITSNNEIVRWKYVVDSTAISVDKVKGIFISPTLYVKEDLGFWKELIWEETKPTGTEIIIYMRNADSEEELMLKQWDYAFYSLVSESGTITRSLNNIGLNGKYLQLKTEMTTSLYGVDPSIAKITINYSTKQASYFFTNKISLENNANAQKGLLVASMTEPQNTEIKFGISSTDSIDWNDYNVITPDEAFALDNVENVKIGIKFISYDEHIPEIDEFALMVGSEKIKALRT